MSKNQIAVRAGAMLRAIPGWLVLAGFVVVGLATLAAAPRLAVEALNRSADVVVAFEREAKRSGSAAVYPTRF